MFIKKTRRENVIFAKFMNGRDMQEGVKSYETKFYVRLMLQK